MTLRLKLRAARAARGLSIRDLAAATGLATNTILYAETGKKNPSPLTLARLAVALDLELEELLVLAEAAT